MTVKIIDGKKIASQFFDKIKAEVSVMKNKPGIAIVKVGNDPASEIYINNKLKKAAELGFYVERFNLDEKSTLGEILKVVDKLNQNNKIHGFIVQLPLPTHIDEKLIMGGILPQKDVDGFTPLSMGNLAIGNNLMIPATAKGCLELIKSTGQKISGKNAVIVGRSNIVGKPLALLLLQENATVTICHSKTRNLVKYTQNADILVAAVGKSKLITADMVKKGSIVIDVGINKVGSKIIGDVDFENVKDVAGYITPVPGGVGPMTIAMLLENTLKASKLPRSHY
jgi:methylenetetrahydrofolate dehydrogenase (NADP+) / methenyltetrahydrofolate cyclohydrolase